MLCRNKTHAADTVRSNHMQTIKPKCLAMKSITKLSFITATAAVIVSSAAFADDPQLQNRLAMQRAQMTQENEAKTTIGVYAQGRGVGRSTTREMRSEARPELRSDAHGHTYRIYVPGR